MFVTVVLLSVTIIVWCLVRKIKKDWLLKMNTCKVSVIEPTEAERIKEKVLRNMNDPNFVGAIEDEREYSQEAH